MKSFAKLLLASCLGGAIVLLGFFVLNPKINQKESNQPIQTPVRLVNNVVAKSYAPTSFVAAAKASMPAVVSIVGSSKGNSSFAENPFGFFGDDQGQVGSGSGVIYTQDGYIITNNHVVEYADELQVTLYDNREFSAEVVGKYPNSDLAVIKIEGEGFPVMNIGNSDEIQVGEWVLAVGNPFSLTSTVTAGIVSAKGRSLRIIKDASAIEAFIQTDAAVNPGNSGGALVDTQGQLIGINTAIASRTGVFQGYSFAIPINLVKRIIDDIIEYGEFRRPILGIVVDDLNADWAEKLNVNYTQGVVIASVEANGSADKAGLKPDDVILGVDNKELKSVPGLQEAVSRAAIGDIIRVKISRKGKILELPVKLFGE